MKMQVFFLIGIKVKHVKPCKILMEAISEAILEQEWLPEFAKQGILVLTRK